VLRIVIRRPTQS